jgi:hypothetical protein
MALQANDTTKYIRIDSEQKASATILRFRIIDEVTVKFPIYFNNSTNYLVQIN